MKIIEPSATIIEDELSALSIHQRIAYVAGVCYQREPRKTEEEAQAFCRKMVEIGHFSTLEMAVVHVVIDLRHVDIPESKYLLCSNIYNADNENLRIVTGSIRAFLEAENPPEVYKLLHQGYPNFFTRFPCLRGDVRFAEPDEIPWQHRHVAARFIVNRAVSHELVRHRPCAFLQESQRFCPYDDEVVFIRPHEDWPFSIQLEIANDFERLEERYKYYRIRGLSPQQARTILPNATKTELIMYASLPQWKHVFNLRCSHAADPEIRRVMVPLREKFVQKYPEAFE